MMKLFMYVVKIDSSHPFPEVHAHCMMVRNLRRLFNNKGVGEELYKNAKASLGKSFAERTLR